MPANPKAVEVFVSYSRRDRKHLDRLRAHLAPLERGHRVRCWWDGELEVGKAWEPKIWEALGRADVVVLLLTADFLASEFCNKELLSAREREKKGEIDLIPVLVESFDLEAHWLREVQAVTVEGKAVTQCRLRSKAWEQVAKQIRMKVECIEGRRPVMQALNEVEEVVHSGDVRLAQLPPNYKPQTTQFPTVSAFWRARSTVLPELDLVTVPGTLSLFAPMLMGPPLAKRGLHRAFRKAIETHRRFGERKRLTINACMSISAGQMVHRAVRAENKKRLLGLYESIVRNAIPIFVLPEYYDQELLPAFRDSDGSGCFEAVVTGRLFQLDNNYIRRFLGRQGIDRILPGSVLEDLCRDAYALEVGGPRTLVRRLADQPVRYLDGDVWLAVQSEGAERFLTGFVNIADGDEREEEMHRLREQAQEDGIIAAYDNLQSIAQLLEGNAQLLDGRAV